MVLHTVIHRIVVLRTLIQAMKIVVKLIVVAYFLVFEFESAMYKACSNVSWGASSSGHYYVTFNVVPHVYISRCTFEFNVKLTKYDNYNNSDASSIKSKIESERNKILNNARAEVKKLQAKYKNYDNVNISVQVNIDEAWD